MDELDKLKKHFKDSNSRNSQYGQSVPDNYFEDLEKNILLAVSQNEKEAKPIAKNNTLFASLIKISSVAAAVLFLIVGINYFTEDSPESYADISESEFSTEYFLETEDLYTEDLLEIEGIDEVLDELEEQLNN